MVGLSSQQRIRKEMIWRAGTKSFLETDAGAWSCDQPDDALYHEKK
jgi:hypothetical protein